MKTSQWRPAVENRCVFSDRLKALSDTSDKLLLCELCVHVFHFCDHFNVVNDLGLRQLQLYWWRGHKREWRKQYCGSGSVCRHFVLHVETRCLLYHVLRRHDTYLRQRTVSPLYDAQVKINFTCFGWLLTIISPVQTTQRRLDSLNSR